MFRIFDSDQSGRVTLKNLKQIRDKLGEKASDKEMEQMIKWAVAGVCDLSSTDLDGALFSSTREATPTIDVDSGFTQSQFIQVVSISSLHTTAFRPQAGGGDATDPTLPSSTRLSYREMMKIRKNREDLVNASMPGGWGISAPKAKVYH